MQIKSAGPSAGVETTSGRAWVGVDQQVGHGSADALYALTDEQYAAVLAAEWALDAFLLECWRGEHPDLRLHEPGGGRWLPQRWMPARSRAIPTRFDGEIWHHVDALTEQETGEREAASRALAGGTSPVRVASDGAREMTFRLTGDTAYPRPAGLIGGLTVGSSREQADAILGERIEGRDAYRLEGALICLGYVDGGLTEIALAQSVARPMPGGAIRALLTVLGQPEEGPAFRSVITRVGAEVTCRRWAGWAGRDWRLSTYDTGMEILTTDLRVASVRVRLGVTRYTEALFPDAPTPPSREQVWHTLGAPTYTHAGHELYHYGDRELIIRYSGDTAADLTTVMSGAGVDHDRRRERSGEYTLFLDVLGLDQSHPLVQKVRGLDGVRIDTRRGTVTRVTIGDRGNPAERFAAFIGGIPAAPTRADIGLTRPRQVGDRGELRQVEGAWVHTHALDGSRISLITVSEEQPRNVGMRE